MSKSEGNVITPQEIMDPGLLIQRMKGRDSSVAYHDQGPDALRLWAATSDFQKDVTIGYEALQNNSRMMKKLRMTFKVLIGLQVNSAFPIPIVYKQLSLVDRIALVHLKKLDAEVQTCYESYEFHKAMAAINNYIRTDFSRFYMESIKDRLYLDGAQSLSRLQGLAVLWEIFQRLIHRVSPILPLLTEEASYYMARETGRDCAPLPWKARVLQSLMATWKDEKLEEHMPVLFETKSIVNALQENYGRKLHKIGSSLQSYVHIEFGTNPHPASQLFQTWSTEELEAFFVVSKVCLDSTPDPSVAWQTSAPVKTTVNDKSYEFTVHLGAVTDQKCVRCWKYVVSDEEAKDVEQPLCRRCLGVWSRDDCDAATTRYADANLPRVQAATKALLEYGQPELSTAWKAWHWDIALGKLKSWE